MYWQLLINLNVICHVIYECVISLYNNQKTDIERNKWNKFEVVLYFEVNKIIKIIIMVKVA